MQARDPILAGGQRAAGIVNSMLGYARNHGIERVPTDVARLVEEALTLTEKDLAKHRVSVDRRFFARPVVPVVPGQIEQILVYLTINARQPMPLGGRLALEVREDRVAGM